MTSQPVRRGPAAVRLALPKEASQLAAIQRRAWLAYLDPELATELLSLGERDMAASWEQAIVRPPLAQFRVLVAVDDSDVVRGFVAVGPSPDPDNDPQTVGLIAEFVVDPDARRGGHGSRLLNAAVDTLRSDGFEQATVWVPTTADDLRAFVTSTGWEPDGGHREVGTEQGTPLREIRLHCAL